MSFLQSGDHQGKAALVRSASLDARPLALSMLLSLAPLQNVRSRKLVFLYNLKQWNGEAATQKQTTVVLSCWMDRSDFRFSLVTLAFLPERDGWQPQLPLSLGVPAFLSETSDVRDGSVVPRLSAGLVDSEDSLGLSSNRGALVAVREENGSEFRANLQLASEKTPQSVLNLADHLLMRLVVASLGENRKDKPNREVSARVLFDGTRGQSVSRRIQIRDQERAPIASDLKRVLREKSR